MLGNFCLDHFDFRHGLSRLWLDLPRQETCRGQIRPNLLTLGGAVFPRRLDLAMAPQDWARLSSIYMLEWLGCGVGGGWEGGWREGDVKTSGLAAKSYRWMANAVAQAHAYIRMCHEKSNQLESFRINCRQARLEEEPNMDDVRPRPTYTCLVFLENASDCVWPRPSNNATWEWKCLMVVHICHGWGQTVLQPTTYCWQGGRATS